MPSLNGSPDLLAPYSYHGVELSGSGEQRVGDCPFCGKEGKFYVSATTGQWRCFVCAEGSDKGGGNVSSFLNKLLSNSDEATKDYSELVQERGFLDFDGPMAWGCCRSITTGEWLVPGWGGDGKLKQLYKWVPIKGKKRLLPTPGLDPTGNRHGMFGINLYDKTKKTVYLVEGVWNAITLWEVLRGSRQGEDKLEVCASETISLLAKANVLALPGCNIFDELWGPLLAGKKVVMIYDSDHPRRQCEQCKKSFSAVEADECPDCQKPLREKVIAPAAASGLARTAKLLLAQIKNGKGQGGPPSEISYLKWGTSGYDPEKPSGYDLRDHFTQEPKLPGRVQILAALLEKVHEWDGFSSEGTDGQATSGAGSSNARVVQGPLYCSSWSVLQDAWRRPMKWYEGLDVALSVMLASVVSTKLLGDQLWVKVIGPPSCGKTDLCEALSFNKEYIFPASIVRGIHSGFKTDGEGSEDHSMIPLMKDRTLVIKDGDTLLKSPNMAQILSELRDLYDRNTRSKYRNNVHREYKNIRTTIILCGTESLREIDSSELGERFLDVKIVDRLDFDLERDISNKVALKVERELSMLSGDTDVEQEADDKVYAKRLTAGYISWLRENAATLVGSVVASEDALETCQDLAEFVSYMRARPSRKEIVEKAQKEMPFRLVAQLVRLAKCLGAVMNRSELDEEVMYRVKKVARDTARGTVLDICEAIRETGLKGISVDSLSVKTSQGSEGLRTLLRFLAKIGVTESYSVQSGFGKQTRWKLTPRVGELMDKVLGSIE